MDPGDNVKGAASNAFKKAALRFGIGAYLRDPAAKNRIRAGQRYQERNGGRADEAATRAPAPGRQGGGDRRPPAERAGQPGPAATAPGGKELEVRVVEAPKRRQDARACEAVVEDGKGNRAVLVARRPGLVATLAEAKPGALLTVRGQIRTEDGRPLPVFEASDLVIPQPGGAEGGESGRLAGESGVRRTYAVRLVGQVDKSRDSKSGRAVVADADGSKAVLVTGKPALTAILAAQKPGTRLRVVGELRREGSDLLLVAASVRPAGESAA